MCGIIGLTFTESFQGSHQIQSLLSDLLVLSESRGKEASGLALYTERGIRFMRTPFPASELVKSAVFSNEVRATLEKSVAPFAAIVHSRLVTNGYEHDNHNNQPVVTGSSIAVHNGIIVNYREIWHNHPQLIRETD
ncbi:MAG: hypothetical protein RL386_469, partial [Bacteroidota bacterium]